jgi:hypothetical protein
MVEEFRAELMDAAAALALPKLRGIIVFGSKGSWLVAAPAAEGEREFAIPLIAEVRAALLGLIAACACEEVVPLAGGVAAAELSVWLMLTS